MLLLVVGVAVVVLVVVLVLALQRAGGRRPDRSASATATAAVTEQLSRLATENLRLHRAIGVAEQALRSVANDTRLDPGLALQVDAALDDVRRTARGDGDDPALGG